jgi:hypothetical protein
MAASWLGLDATGKIMSDFYAKRLTAKEAAREFVTEIGNGWREESGSLLNPMIQFFNGLNANEDPFTHRKIMPDAVHKEFKKDAFNKYARKYWLSYLGEKVVTPIAQFSRTRRGTEPTTSPVWDWLKNGPLNVQRALGFYTVDPARQQISEHFETAQPIQAANEYYKTKFYDVINEYGEDATKGLSTQAYNRLIEEGSLEDAAQLYTALTGVETTELPRTMPMTEEQRGAAEAVDRLVESAKDNGLSALDYGPWLENLTAQRLIVNAELRKTSDPARRKELLERKRMLIRASKEQLRQQVPKVGMRQFVDEIRRRGQLPEEAQ